MRANCVCRISIAIASLNIKSAESISIIASPYLCEMSESDKKIVTSQVEFYKKWREVFQFGDYYRLPDYGYMIVTRDQKKAVGFVVEKGSRPNNDYRKLKCVGLDDDKL